MTEKREYVEGEEMQLFEDEKLTRPAKKIDWGRPDVGSHNEVVLYLANFDRTWTLSNIKATENDEDVHIEHPIALRPDSAAKVTITWNPKLTRRKELDVTHLLTGELWIG